MRSCSLSSRLLLLWICFFLSYYSCDEQEIGASCKYWGLGKHNVLMKNLETNRTQCMRYFFSPLNGWLCLTFYVFTSILISLISFRIWLNENVVRHHRESAMWWYEILARWRSRQRNDFCCCCSCMSSPRRAVHDVQCIVNWFWLIWSNRKIVSKLVAEMRMR